MRPTAWRRTWAAGMIALGLLCGCEGRKFGEVEGTVTVDGKPLPDVEVVFVPDAARGNRGNNASAITDGQGRYRLRSLRDRKDGTVLGPHRVTVIDLLSVPDTTAVGGLTPGGAAQPAKPTRPKEPRFPAIYTDLERTPFQDIEVQPGKQTLNLDLKSNPR